MDIMAKSKFRYNIQYYVLKVIGGRYDGMYLEHLDRSGYSHVDDIEYAKPFSSYEIGTQLNRYLEGKGYVDDEVHLLPIHIRKIDSKWKKEKPITNNEIDEICGYADEIVKEMEK